MRADTVFVRCELSVVGRGFVVRGWIIYRKRDVLRGNVYDIDDGLTGGWKYGDRRFVGF